MKTYNEFINEDSLDTFTAKKSFGKSVRFTHNKYYVGSLYSKEIDVLQEFKTYKEANIFILDRERSSTENVYIFKISKNKSEFIQTNQ